MKRLIATVLALSAGVALAQTAPALPDLENTALEIGWQDFKSLVERTYVPPTPFPKPPTEAFLRSAVYRGRLERGVLSLDAEVRLEVLKQGWVRVPLWSSGAVVSFDGDGAMLNRNGGHVEALALGPASFEIRARLVLPASDHPGENRLSLRLPDGPVSLLDVEAGAGIRELDVEAGLAYRRQSSRVWVALIGGAATLRYTLPFARAEDEAGEELELEPRVLVTAYQLLNLGGGVVSGALVHDYQVRVAKVDHFDVLLEDGVEVFEVATEGLESWKILQRETEKILRVKLTAPADGAVRVVVSFEGSYDPGIGLVPVPSFAPEGVERESGFVAVAADGAEVDLALAGNLLPADVSEIPDDVRGWGGNLVTGYRYSGVPDRAQATVTEHEDAAVLMAIVERLNATTVLLANGIEASWLDLVVKTNRKQFLRLRLPADEVEIWSLLVDGDPARPKHTDNEVLVPLPTAAEEVTARISLVLLRKGSEMGSFSTVEPYLPRLDVPVSEAMWSVYMPSDRLYTVVDDEFSVVEETAALRPRRRSGIGLVGVASQAMAPSYDAVARSGVSEEAYVEQKKQEDKIQQQLKARQRASRKGALPVRIAVPGGISSMAKVTVARILMVDEDETVLPVRTYPRWLRSVLRYLQLVLILAAGVLFGLLLAGRLTLHRSLPVAAFVFALIPIGGFGVVFVVFMTSFVTAVVWGGSLIASRRKTNVEE